MLIDVDVCLVNYVRMLILLLSLFYEFSSSLPAYMSVFKPVIQSVMEFYQPTCVVLQVCVCIHSNL